MFNNFNREERLASNIWIFKEIFGRGWRHVVEKDMLRGDLEKRRIYVEWQYDGSIKWHLNLVLRLGHLSTCPHSSWTRTITYVIVGASFSLWSIYTCVWSMFSLFLSLSIHLYMCLKHALSLSLSLTLTDHNAAPTGCNPWRIFLSGNVSSSRPLFSTQTSYKEPTPPFLPPPFHISPLPLFLPLLSLSLSLSL